jgi:ribosomal protein L11 methyltransferase
VGVGLNSNRDLAASLCEPHSVIVVIATTEAELPRVHARLADSAVRVTRVRSPSPARRLVLASVSDEGEADRLAATLRAENMIAVARPDDGPRLEAWLRHTGPVVFGRSLSVCFAWSEHDRSSLANLVELGPGGFGNGDHPSTRLILEALIARMKGGERVLDVGCGSGVLGLAAVRLGAAHALAVDVDASAVEATRRNAALNGMGEHLHATLGPLRDLGAPFDIVVANVGRAAVVELAPELVRLVAADGWLAVSGISAAQAAQIVEFLTPLVETHRRVSGEWAAVALAREPPAPNAIV